MSDTPRTDALCDDLNGSLLTDYDRILDLARTLERELAALRAEVERLRDWLDYNTTFYDVQSLLTHANVPALAIPGTRIWYHATDDKQSYPFSAVINVAMGK